MDKQMFVTEHGREKWLICPICRKKLLRLLPTTTAEDMPVFCKRCHNESIVSISNTQVYIHPRA